MRTASVRSSIRTSCAAKPAAKADRAAYRRPQGICMFARWRSHVRQASHGLLSVSALSSFASARAAVTTLLRASLRCLTTAMSSRAARCGARARTSGESVRACPVGSGHTDPLFAESSRWRGAPKCRKTRSIVFCASVRFANCLRMPSVSAGPVRRPCSVIGALACASLLQRDRGREVVKSVGDVGPPGQGHAARIWYAGAGTGRGRTLAAAARCAHQRCRIISLPGSPVFRLTSLIR